MIEKGYDRYSHLKREIEQKIDSDIESLNDELRLKCPPDHNFHRLGFFMLTIIKFLLRKIYDLNSTKE